MKHPFRWLLVSLLAAASANSCTESAEPVAPDVPALAVAPAGAIPITTCPFNITQPGIYVLAVDASCQWPSPVSINSSNVTLYLGGHQVSGQLSKFSYAGGMNIGAVSNVRVFGPGQIVGENAINISGAHHVQISDIRLRALEWVLVATNTTDLLVERTRFRTGAEAGIALLGSDSSTIRGNTIRMGLPEKAALYLRGTHHVLVTENVIIPRWGGGQAVTIENGSENDILHNRMAQAGISIIGNSSGNRVMRNVFETAWLTDLSTACDNTWGPNDPNLPVDRGCADTESGPMP